MFIIKLIIFFPLDATAARSLLRREGKLLKRRQYSPRKGLLVERTEEQTDVQHERLAQIVECCLESEPAYKLFDMLGAISKLDVDAKLHYMDLVRESGVYSEEEVQAIGRLILTGTAQYFKDMIDKVREEQVRREIDEMMLA